jgi:hypothetical protein
MQAWFTVSCNFVMQLSSAEATMQQQLTDEEIHKMQERLFELKQEHRDLDDVINRLLMSPDVEELQIKRFKKRKLMLKDTISKLENTLIPDILA